MFVRLSETRDMAGTKAFFVQALEIHETVPEIVTTDGLASYPRAIKEELGDEVEHQVVTCTSNPVEQSHRRVKYRYYPSLGYGEFNAAQRFCQAVGEVAQFLRPQSRMAEFTYTPFPDFLLFQSLSNRIINRLDTKVAQMVLIEFHSNQRGSKSIRATFWAVLSIESTSRVCNLLFRGILIVKVGN